MSPTNYPTRGDARVRLADAPCNETETNVRTNDRGECRGCGFPTDCHDY